MWCVTLVWAFSFSLIGVYLAGQVDGYFAVMARMALAALVLLPFFRPGKLGKGLMMKLMAIGAVQIGLMYLFLYQSFLFLSVAEVLFFTIFTPVYISLIQIALTPKVFTLQLMVSIGLAVGASALMRYYSLSDTFWLGAGLVQLANLCFALGQVAYREVRKTDTSKPQEGFACFFLGALLVSGITFLCIGDYSALPDTHIQWLVLVWLGVGASGAGYLCWAWASTRVNIGQLAVMNNLLIPAGLIVNLVFWGNHVKWLHLVVGTAVLLVALYLCRERSALVEKQG